MQAGDKRSSPERGDDADERPATGMARTADGDGRVETCRLPAEVLEHIALHCDLRTTAALATIGVFAPAVCAPDFAERSLRTRFAAAVEAVGHGLIDVMDARHAIASMERLHGPDGVGAPWRVAPTAAVAFARCVDYRGHWIRARGPASTHRNNVLSSRLAALPRCAPDADWQTRLDYPGLARVVGVGTPAVVQALADADGKFRRTFAVADVRVEMHEVLGTPHTHCVAVYDDDGAAVHLEFKRYDDNVDTVPRDDFAARISNALRSIHLSGVCLRDIALPPLLSELRCVSCTVERVDFGGVLDLRNLDLSYSRVDAASIRTLQPLYVDVLNLRFVEFVGASVIDVLVFVRLAAHVDVTGAGLGERDIAVIADRCRFGVMCVDASCDAARVKDVGTVVHKGITRVHVVPGLVRRLDFRVLGARWPSLDSIQFAETTGMVMTPLSLCVGPGRVDWHFSTHMARQRGIGYVDVTVPCSTDTIDRFLLSLSLPAGVVSTHSTVPSASAPSAICVGLRRSVTLRDVAMPSGAFKRVAKLACGGPIVLRNVGLTDELATEMCRVITSKSMASGTALTVTCDAMTGVGIKRLRVAATQKAHSFTLHIEGARWVGVWGKAPAAGVRVVRRLFVDGPAGRYTLHATRVATKVSTLHHIVANVLAGRNADTGVEKPFAERFVDLRRAGRDSAYGADDADRTLSAAGVTEDDVFVATWRVAFAEDMPMDE